MNSTWTAASPSSPDPKWRLVTRLLGTGRLGAKSRPCCQGAGDTAAPVEAAVGAAQATVDDAADAGGGADETRRRARSVTHCLAPGGNRGCPRRRHLQLSPRSRQTAASPLAR